MQKIVEFYHNKSIDMLKLGCTKRNLANIGLLSSTGAKSYPFTACDKELASKVWEDMVSGPSEVSTRKAVVDEIHICNFTIGCKSIVGIDTSQIYPYSTCQPMLTRLITRYEFDADLQRFKPRPKKSRSSDFLVMSYFQRMKTDCRFESF